MLGTTAEAEDVFQESALRAWRRVVNLRDGERFQPWLLGIDVGFATIWNNIGPQQLLETHDGGRTWVVIAVCKKPLGVTYPPDTCAHT
jgi:photosystem II stability/assembly factor-like uncharacterized protein